MDQDFLLRLKSGDGEAFRALVIEHQAKVRSICYRFLRNLEDAEDAAQDVFVDVHGGLPEFREEAELSTWIHRIAVARSLDILRRRNRKKRFDGLRRLFAGPEAAEKAPAPETTDPVRALEGKERALVLQQAVASLPERQRIVVTLSKYEGLGNQEIADILNTTLVSVESLAHRAHLNLRDKLTRHYERRSREGDEHEPPVKRQKSVQ